MTPVQARILNMKRLRFSWAAICTRTGLTKAQARTEYWAAKGVAA